MLKIGTNQINKMYLGNVEIKKLYLGSTKVFDKTFLPTNILDLRSWHDASDISTITHSSNLVSEWRDKSGNAYHATQSTYASKPLTNTAAVNGLNSIDFDGTDDFLTVGPLGQLTNTENTFFVVVKLDATNGGWDLSIPGGGSGRRLGTWYENDARMRMYAGNATASFVLQAANFSIPIITGARKLADLSFVGFTGTTVGGNSTSANLSSTIGYFGTFVGSSQFLNGKICECITYGRALSDLEMAQVGAYLSDKWGASWSI